MSVSSLNESYGDDLTLTPHPPWAQQFWDDLVPLKEQVAEHPLFLGMAAGDLPVATFQDALLNFFPLVENFPKYMGLSLAKCATNQPGHGAVRGWLLNNMRVEARHAQWYRDWAVGFGVPSESLETVRPPAAMDAVNYYLWHTCREGSLIESIGAANLAIEWATGEWAQQVVRGMKAYAERGEAQVDRRTMAWLRAHAHYDDAHPHEAMELIKALAVGEEDVRKAFLATERGLEYYRMALDDCWARAVDLPQTVSRAEVR